MIRRRRTSTAPTPQPWAWPGPYLGAGPGGPICAGPQSGLLVLGPPRTGKTSAVIIPNVLAAPGAVVVTSTKTDVLDVTAAARHRRGRLWLFDPTGAITIPDGSPLGRLCFSPVPGCENWDRAIATAKALVRASQPARGVLDPSHWTERAEATLAPLLHACALIDKPVEWVLRWVNRRELAEPLNILAHKRADLAADVLAGIAETEERERSGIFSTAAGVLAAYRSTNALHQAAWPNFDPDAIVCSADTVYICAGADAQEVSAPLVLALLERIRAATYNRPAGHPAVLWALDEMANIAPIPSLPQTVSEGGGQGLLTIGCLQDLTQARARWPHHADGFFTLFGAKLILPGLGDHRTLRLISDLAGHHDVAITSRNRPGSWYLASRTPVTVNTSWRREPVLPPDQISRGYPGAALAIQGTSRPTWISLTPWWTPPWTHVAGSPHPSA